MQNSLATCQAGIVTKLILGQNQLHPLLFLAFPFLFSFFVLALIFASFVVIYASAVRLPCDFLYITRLINTRVLPLVFLKCHVSV